jgi:phosphohistidine phosphatase
VKQLLILRHAKSSWADASIDDWHRPLNDRGRRDAPRVGEWLREQSLIPDLIVTSDAVRALTTAQAAAGAAGYARDIVLEPSLYHAGPADVIAVLNGMRDQAAQTVMIVGHNPGLEDLLRQLTGEYHGLPTTALVQLELPIDSWSELAATTPASIVDSWQPR